MKVWKRCIIGIMFVLLFFFAFSACLFCGGITQIGWRLCGGPVIMDEMDGMMHGFRDLRLGI